MAGIPRGRAYRRAVLRAGDLALPVGRRADDLTLDKRRLAQILAIDKHQVEHAILEPRFVSLQIRFGLTDHASVENGTSGVNLANGSSWRPGIPIEIALTQEAAEIAGEAALIVPWRKPPARVSRELMPPIEGAHPDAQPIRSDTRAKLLAGLAKSRGWLDELVAGRILDIASPDDPLNRAFARLRAVSSSRALVLSFPAFRALRKFILRPETEDAKSGGHD